MGIVELNLHYSYTFSASNQDQKTEWLKALQESKNKEKAQHNISKYFKYRPIS